MRRRYSVMQQRGTVERWMLGHGYDKSRAWTLGRDKLRDTYWLIKGGLESEQLEHVFIDGRWIIQDKPRRKSRPRTP